MGLASELFRGDPKLEAAAVSDPAHIVPGATGPHVRKIQTALFLLDVAAIADDELRRTFYGPSTAGAVLAYKQKRKIVNRSYQTQADDIVGKMTIASLDNEMHKLEVVPHGPVRIVPRSYWVMRPVSDLAAKFGATENKFGMHAFPGELTIQQGSIGSFDVVDGSPGSIAIEDPGIAKIKPTGNLVAPGDRFAVTKSRQSFQVLSGQKSGTTRITATTATSAASLNVAVNPARPILFLDSSWTTMERTKILVALQQLTSDTVLMKGDEVFVDTSHSVPPNRNVGKALLRGLQHPARKVTIVPAKGGLIPETKVSDNDALVEVAFAGGDLATFHFFTITGANVPGPGGNAVEKSPGFIPLAHELVHAFRILRGHAAGGPSRDHEFFDPSGSKFIQRVFLEELIVVGIDGSEPISENRIRAEHGLGSREAYASPTFALDLQGVRPAGAKPSWWPDYPVH
jgi:hypothetical protein